MGAFVGGDGDEQMKNGGGGILGDGELRMMYIHEEGKREKMEGLLII